MSLYDKLDLFAEQNKFYNLVKKIVVDSKSK